MEVTFSVVFDRTERRHFTGRDLCFGERWSFCNFNFDTDLTGARPWRIIDEERRRWQKNIGSVIVGDGASKITGVVSERYLLRRVFAQNLKLATSRVASVMTSGVMTENPDHSVIDRLGIISNARFRHLPVVDDDENSSRSCRREILFPKYGRTC